MGTAPSGVGVNCQVSSLSYPMDMQGTEGLRHYSKSWTLKIKDLSGIILKKSTEYDQMLKRLIKKGRQLSTQK